MHRLRLIVLTGVLACAGAWLAACSRAPLHHQESFVFGTRVEILIAGLDESQARPAATAVLREFDRLHRTYHAWQPSELSELNTAIAAGKSHVVTPEMSALLSDAQRLSALGEGLFDPGIGRLIDIYRQRLATEQLMTALLLSSLLGLLLFGVFEVLGRFVDGWRGLAKHE